MQRFSFQSVALVVTVFLVSSACGSSDSTDADADQTKSSTAATDPIATPDTTKDQSREPEDTDNSASDGGDSSTATLTLDNGEILNFSIMCMLQPQENFDFSIASYDAPYNLDFSRWSENSGFSGTYVELNDATTYDPVWSADSGAGIGDLIVTEEGSTVTATGTFFAGEDSSGEHVGGELVAHC